MVHYYVPGGATLNQGLVGYWKCDDFKVSGANKIIDYGRFGDGTITGTITASNDPRGRTNEAIDITNGSFDSTKTLGDYIDSIDASDAAYSICFWVNLTSKGQEIDVIFTLKETEFKNFYLGTHFERGIGFYYGDADDISVGSPPDLNAWQHVAFVISNKTNVKIYINGILTKTGIASSISGDLTTNPRIGLNYDPVADRGMQGSISRIRVYNRELTDGEASKLHRLKL